MSEAAGSATKLLYFCLLPAVNMFAVPELKILLSREQIAKRVAEMAAEISRDFAGQPIILLGVLKGAAIFLSDLARQVQLDLNFDFIGVSRHGTSLAPGGQLKKTGAGGSTGEGHLTRHVYPALAGR